jgi:hypothetical protein
MNLSEIVACVNNKIKGTALYDWECFGPDARYFEVGTEQFEHLASVIFDFEDGTVYAVELFLPPERKAWRWVDDRFFDLYLQECIENGVNPNIAYDNVRFDPVNASELMLMLYELTKDFDDDIEFKDLDDEDDEEGVEDDATR